MVTPRFSTSPKSQDCYVCRQGDDSIFWDAGALLVNCLDKGHTIIRVYYAHLLSQLWEKIKQIQRGKLTRELFHQDNVPPCMSSVAMAAIQKYGFQLVEHSPYSPDLAPSDYLFPKSKKEPSGYHFCQRWWCYDCYGPLSEGTEKICLLYDFRTKCVNVGGDYVEKLLYLIF